MAEDSRDSVIRLDERGIELLKTLAGTRSEFRIASQQDGSITLHPMSTDDADLWLAGLVDEIVENFTHRDWMIRVKPDKL